MTNTPAPNPDRLTHPDNLAGIETRELEAIHAEFLDLVRRTAPDHDYFLVFAQAEIDLRTEIEKRAQN